MACVGEVHGTVQRPSLIWDLVICPGPQLCGFGGEDLGSSLSTIYNLTITINFIVGGNMGLH